MSMRISWSSIIADRVFSCSMRFLLYSTESMAVQKFKFGMSIEEFKLPDFDHGLERVRAIGP